MQSNWVGVEGRVRQGHALEVGHFKPEGEIWTFSYNREGSRMGFQAEGVTCLIFYFREITLIGVWQKDGSVTVGWLRRGVRAVLYGRKTLFGSFLGNSLVL